MPTLVDTNLLLRSAEPAHPMCAMALNALAVLRARGARLCVVPQNLIEFWSVATRPVERNGLGMTAAQALTELARLETLFIVLPDTPAIYEEWRLLVVAHGVTGVNVHDTRLVAAMRVHGVTDLLTFDQDHFNRYAGITVIDLHTVTQDEEEEAPTTGDADPE
jgi:predicted nucleic acid-binding protein